MSSLFLIRMDGGPAVDTSGSKRRPHVGLRRLLLGRWLLCIGVLVTALAACVGTIVPQFVRQQHKERCAEKLNRLGLALHEYQDAQGHFPAAGITDKNGTPLLSWRV